mmetsp:Transcript_37601/g.72073  ORF Transcript_37601/g.72073 Transcript_37601/m.72073 type:complete len:359 (-) Transcript_37601:3211-4287(-)
MGVGARARACVGRCGFPTDRVRGRGAAACLLSGVGWLLLRPLREPGMQAGEQVHRARGALHPPHAGLCEGERRLQTGHEADARNVGGLAHDKSQSLEPARRRLLMARHRAQQRAHRLPRCLRPDVSHASLEEAQHLLGYALQQGLRDARLQLEKQLQRVQQLLRAFLLVGQEALADAHEADDGALHQGPRGGGALDDVRVVLVHQGPQHQHAVAVAQGDGHHLLETEQPSLLVVPGAGCGGPRGPDERTHEVQQALGLQKLAVRKELVDAARLHAARRALLRLQLLRAAQGGCAAALRGARAVLRRVERQQLGHLVGQASEKRGRGGRALLQGLGRPHRCALRLLRLCHDAPLRVGHL